MYKTLLTIQYISVFMIFFESGYIFLKMKTRLQTYLFFMCVATFISNLGYLMEMKSQTYGEYMISLRLSYAGKVWIPFSLFLFTLALCKIKFSDIVLKTLAVIHALTFILVLFCDWSDLYYTTADYVVGMLFPYIVFGHGIWYKGYSLLLVAYIVFGLYNLFVNVIREKDSVTKKRLLFVTLAILSYCAGYIIYICKLTSNYDTTNIGYTVGAIFLLVGLFKYGLLDTLQLAKDYVVDELSEAIVVLDLNGNIEYCNGPALKIYEALSFNDRQFIAYINDSVESKQPIRVNDRIYSPTIKKIEQNGGVKGTVYALVDDTEHYDYMVALQEQKEIAENANASKTAFLSVVSHEIRTPMNAVVGMTELLLREPENLTSKQQKYLKNIKTSGSSLVMIVNDILDQSKIEAGKMELVDDDYELRPMLEDVKLIIENRIGSKPIHLICEIDDEVPQFLIGDSLRIRQILINLMNNAVKFTEEGYIRLSIEVVDSNKDKRLLKFSIKDSGQGIREEDLNRLGEAFTQVDAKRNHSKEGTGLGLSISRDFISLMGGQLEVKSEYGNGSEFFFSIWQGVSNGLEVTNASGITKQAWQEEEEFTASTAKILVVDDVELNCMIAKELLSETCVCVDTVTSGEEAIELLKDKHYDMIFMDYMMPYMDGIETTTKIRAMAMNYSEESEEHRYFISVPIIALSGDDSENTKEKFMRAGIDDFTEKPISTKHMKKLLLKWLPGEMIEPKK